MLGMITDNFTIHNLQVLNMEESVMFKPPIQTELNNTSQQLTLFRFSFQLHTYKRAIYKNISRERVSR